MVGVSPPLTNFSCNLESKIVDWNNQLTTAATIDRCALRSLSTANRNDLTLDDPVFSMVITVLIFGRWVVRSMVLSTLLLTRLRSITSWFAPQRDTSNAENIKISKFIPCILYFYQKLTGFPKQPASTWLILLSEYVALTCMICTVQHVSPYKGWLWIGMKSFRNLECISH